MCFSARLPRLPTSAGRHRLWFLPRFTLIASVQGTFSSVGGRFPWLLSEEPKKKIYPLRFSATTAKANHSDNTYLYATAKDFLFRLLNLGRDGVIQKQPCLSNKLARRRECSRLWSYTACRSVQINFLQAYILIKNLIHLLGSALGEHSQCIFTGGLCNTNLSWTTELLPTVSVSSGIPWRQQDKKKKSLKSLRLHFRTSQSFRWSLAPPGSFFTACFSYCPVLTVEAGTLARMLPHVLSLSLHSPFSCFTYKATWVCYCDVMQPPTSHPTPGNF